MTGKDPRGDVPRLNAKVARAFGHPIRVRLLKALNQRVASASELAKQLQLTENTTNYHIGVLLACECVRVAATRQRSGRDVKFYTATSYPFYSASPVEPAIERKSASGSELHGFLQNARLAIDADSAELHESFFVVESLVLTEAHHRTAEEALHLTVANLRTLDEQSRQLNIATDTHTRPMELGIAMFPPQIADEAE